jgi:hypothetical protein
MVYDPWDVKWRPFYDSDTTLASVTFNYIKVTATFLEGQESPTKCPWGLFLDYGYNEI